MFNSSSLRSTAQTFSAKYPGVLARARVASEKFHSDSKLSIARPKRATRR